MEKTFMTFEQADELDIQDIFIGVDIDKCFKVSMFRDIDSSVMLQAMERVVKEGSRFNYDDHLYEVLAELMETEIMYEEMDRFIDELKRIMLLLGKKSPRELVDTDLIMEVRLKQ